MSWTTEITIWCEGEDCHFWAYGHAYSDRNVATVRRGLRREGWTFRNGCDLCPRCSK